VNINYKDPPKLIDVRYPTVTQHQLPGFVVEGHPPTTALKTETDIEL
jgi:hypothetical protein